MSLLILGPQESVRSKTKLDFSTLWYLGYCVERSQKTKKILAMKKDEEGSFGGKSMVAQSKAGWPS